MKIPLKTPSLFFSLEDGDNLCPSLSEAGGGAEHSKQGRAECSRSPGFQHAPALCAAARAGALGAGALGQPQGWGSMTGEAGLAGRGRSVAHVCSYWNWRQLFLLWVISSNLKLVEQKKEGQGSVLSAFHALFRCVCGFFTELSRKHLWTMEVLLIKLKVQPGLEVICTLFWVQGASHVHLLSVEFSPVQLLPFRICSSLRSVFSTRAAFICWIRIIYSYRNKRVYSNVQSICKSLLR